MCIVNADANELLQSWNNIKTAITSIETTRSSIMRKYQQLDGEWKDKKYIELGNVVQECNKALNEILKILAKGEKFVGSLAKNIQEYEDTEIGSSAVDHSRNSFIESLRSDARVLKKTDAEKLQDFKIGIAPLMRSLKIMRKALKVVVCKGGAVMNAILIDNEICNKLNC